MTFQRICFGISIVAFLLLLVGGPGYQLGFWDLGFGLLGVMRYALYLGIAAAVLGLIGLCWPKIRARGTTLLFAALLLGLLVAAVPVAVRNIASSVPPIHDITTDLDNPPEFVAIKPLRAEAPNPVEYPGEQVAAQQREAYPELNTVSFSADAETVFQAAAAAVDGMGWELVDTNAEAGRIEATDTTLWYGFKDDVVIRIESATDSTRVDVRSKSRIGQSDLGKNAERIKAFIQSLESRLEN